MKQRASTVVTLLTAVIFSLSLAGIALRHSGGTDAGSRPSGRAPEQPVAQHSGAHHQPSSVSMNAALNSPLPVSQPFLADETPIQSGAQPTLLCPSNSDQKSPAGLLPQPETHTNYAEILMDWGWHAWREPQTRQ